MVTRNSSAHGAVYGARMSIPVTLEALAATIDTYGAATFFSPRGRPIRVRGASRT